MQWPPLMLALCYPAWITVRGKAGMNLEKVVFGFFILLAATLNFGFVIGDIGNPDYHHFWEFFAAIVVNLIATVLKFGDRTHIGAVHLASSLVALLQLVAAAIVWFFAAKSAGAGPVSATQHGEYRIARSRRALCQHRIGRDHGGRNDAAEAVNP